MHGGRGLLALTVMLGCAIAPLRGQQAGGATLAGGAAQTSTSVADSLYAAGNAVAAERAYRAVLARDASSSRAVYRLAMLRRDHREAVSLLERYVSLEPTDAWGRIALADARARTGNLAGAMAAYTIAERLAPRERDVQVGRARMLARLGRTDDAIAGYTRWCAQNPRDAEAVRELAVQYRRAGRLQSALRSYELAQRASPDTRTGRRLTALRSTMTPRAEPIVGSSRDSDGNLIWRLGASVGLTTSDATNVTIAGGTQRTSDASDAVRTNRAAIVLAWRPRATTNVEVSAGATFAPSDTALMSPLPAPGGGPGRRPGSGNPPASAGASTHIIPSARVRYTWRDPEGRGRLDLRATHALLDASPLLVRNDVERSEIGGEGELRILGPFAARALLRGASIRSALDANSRATIGGRLVVSTAFLGELGAGLQQLTYAHASTAGYFAPQWTRTAEVGLYRELEAERGTTLAIDLGAGAQRVAEWGATPSNWSPAFRGWAALGVPIAPGRELRVEVESYDAKIGSEIATASSRWRYASGSISLRWSLR